MAIGTIEAFELFKDFELRNRVRVILIRSAVAVLDESGSVPFHLDRVLYAIRVLEDSQTEARKMWLAVVATATAIPDKVTDDQIETVVNGLINALAGAFNPVPTT